MSYKIITEKVTVDQLRDELNGKRKPSLDASSGNRMHSKKEPTGIEKKMASELELLKRTGAIRGFDSQSQRLRLADKTWYLADFVVYYNDGTIEFREVKGSWKMPHQDDSRVKIKVAAEMFPFYLFSAWVPKRGGGWDVERWNVKE